MKVVIAAWHLAQFNVGIGRYTRSLIEAISRVDSKDQYTVLTPKAVSVSLRSGRVQCVVTRLPFLRRRGWEQIVPLLHGPYDLLHFPYDSCVAWKRGKFLVTIHDVKPLLYPELQPRRSIAKAMEGWAVGDRMMKIDHVLTVSEHSKRDIMQYLGVPKDRITVVYPGVDGDWFTRPQAFVPSGAQYILSVAGADPTKNTEAAVKAYAALPNNVRNKFRLMLVGDVQKQSRVRQLVHQLDVDGTVDFTGVVDDEQLRRLYWGATLFVFPSRYEGFGFPVVEAMAAGCPVIASNSSSLPEVGGEAALYADPEDVTALAEAMQLALSSPQLREEMRMKGIERASKFQWERTAQETVEVYRRVAMGG